MESVFQKSSEMTFFLLSCSFCFFRWKCNLHQILLVDLSHYITWQLVHNLHNRGQTVFRQFVLSPFTNLQISMTFSLRSKGIHVFLQTSLSSKGLTPSSKTTTAPTFCPQVRSSTPQTATSETASCDNRILSTSKAPTL